MSKKVRTRPLRPGRKPALRFDAYGIVSDAVDLGIRFGYQRAHKHVEKPGEDHIMHEIHNEVMNALADVVNWEKSG